jgi:magnesium and cobalt transporter
MNEEHTPPPEPLPTRRWLPAWLLPRQKQPSDFTEHTQNLIKNYSSQPLDTDSLRMLKGVLEIADTRVREVMVPHAQIIGLEEGFSVKKVLAVLLESGHSRFPVFAEDRKTVLGILLAKDFLRYCAAKHPASEEPFVFAPYLRPAFFTPESKRLNMLLREFRQHRTHMAIVIDEYGGIAGLLTIEDILEEIVGEIDDEHDTQEEANIQALDDGSFLVNAWTEISEINEFFQQNWSDDSVDTLGGLVIEKLGYLPKINEELSLDGLHIRVLKANKRRLIQLKVTPVPRKPSAVLATDYEDL